MFADAPHLLKLIGNYCLDTGLLVNNELISAKEITDLLKYKSTGDVFITFMISDEHLSVRGAGRQNVKLAAKLFSHSTANAVRRCFSRLNLYKLMSTANFVQLVNDWFDVLNSSSPWKDKYKFIH